MSVPFISAGDPFVAKQIIQFVLSDVAERRVAQVVRQTSGLRRVRVYAPQLRGLFSLVLIQVLCEATSDLPNFERVGQPVVKYVAALWRNDLRDFRESGESACVKYPVAVSLCFSSTIESSFLEEPLLRVWRPGYPFT